MSMAFAGISQTSDTSLPIPVTKLRKAVFLIEQGKLCESENALLYKVIDNLETKIVTKDSIITIYKKNEADYKAVVRYYQDMNKNGEEVIKNLEENLAIHQKLIKRQKFNKYLYVFVGLGIGFFIKK